MSSRLSLLLTLVLQNRHAAEAKAYLLLRLTYNKSLTNLDYEVGMDTAVAPPTAAEPLEPP